MLEGLNVNVFDVHHAAKTRGKVRRFETEEELDAYAYGEGKLFPWIEARGLPMYHLLKDKRRLGARSLVLPEKKNEEEGM